MSSVAVSSPATMAADHNPLIPISAAARAAIVVYFMLWRVFPAAAGMDAQTGMHFGYTGVITLMAVATELLILLPFLLKRFAGMPIGWLHPLILPTMVGIAFGLLRNPAALLTPISAWSQATPVADHVLLAGWTDAAILFAQMRSNFITLLGMVGMYVGFALVRTRRRIATPARVRIDGLKLAIFFGACLLVVLLFLQMQGGVISHMATLAGGRFRMRELSGHFLVLNDFLPYVLLLWYAYRPKAFRNPVFVAAFVLAVALQFVVTGSRSSLFLPLALLLAVWMFRNQRVPATRAILLGLTAVLLLGALGEVRRSGRDGAVDFGALLNSDLSVFWELSQEEQASRARGTSLAVAALVPDHRGYLYGTTYVAAVAFWVPRSIWSGKPRGAGAHAAALLFGGRENMDGYSGGGFPVSGAPEAYWNFGYVGVFVVFGLYGAFLALATRWILAAPDNPYALITLLIVNFALTTPSTTAIVPALQSAVLLYLLYLFASRMRFAR